MPVRFAVVGCGKITERLALPQLAGCRGAAVAGLVDTNRAAATRLIRRFGLSRCRVWTDWRRMLREAEIDAVAVNVPNALHAEVAIAALQAGRHVIVEKPMAISLADADDMIRVAASRRRLLMVEQTQRFDPVHELAHTLLRSGRLGRITQLRGRIGHAGPQYWSGRRSSWFTDRRQSGGGALMDVGSHIVDLLRWLSGKRVARICCRASRLTLRACAVEEHAEALLEFSDGAVGSFEVSWATQPYQLATDFFGARGRLHTEFGASHPLVVHFAKREGDPNQHGRTLRPKVPSSSRLSGAYPYFVRCIASGTKPFIGGEEGRATLEVVLGAYESARRGEWVELPLA